MRYENKHSNTSEKFDYVIIKFRDNLHMQFTGYITWKDKDSFGFEYKMCGNNYANAVLYWDEWLVEYIDC